MAGVPRFPPMNGGYMPPRGINRHPFPSSQNDGYHFSPRRQGCYGQGRGNGYFMSSESGYPPPYQAFQGPYQQQQPVTHGARFPPQRPQKRPNGDHFHNNNFPRKKEKIDKRLLPENNKYFCDTCDRGFKNEEKYQEHVDGHEKCSVEGCSYIAAPKLVRMHFDHQHRTGLAKKIWQAESKDDIAKWIEERKRKFPTAENIIKKKKLEKEKQERGEVLETKSFGKFKQKGNRFNSNNSGEPQQRHQKKRDRRRNKKGFKSANETPNENKSSDVSLPKSQEKGPVSDPLSLLATHSNSSDEAEDTKVEVKPSVNFCNALGALANTYDTSEDEKEEKNDTANKDMKQTSESCPAVNRNLQKPETPKQPLTKQKGKNAGRNSAKNNQRYPSKSLLEKLLANDIRHERNVILQCVKFIVKSNFFEEKSKSGVTDVAMQEKDKGDSKNIQAEAKKESTQEVKVDCLEAEAEENDGVQTQIEDCEIWDGS